MKGMNRITFAAVIGASFLLMNQAKAQYQAKGADGVFASPKMRQILNEQKKMQGTTPDLIGRSLQPGSPKTQAVLNDQKRVAKAAKDPDLAHPRGVWSGKNPFPKRFQVAPMK